MIWLLQRQIEKVVLHHNNIWITRPTVVTLNLLTCSCRLIVIYCLRTSVSLRSFLIRWLQIGEMQHIIRGWTISCCLDTPQLLWCRQSSGIFCHVYSLLVLLLLHFGIYLAWYSTNCISRWQLGWCCVLNYSIGQTRLSRLLLGHWLALSKGWLASVHLLHAQF